MGGGRRKEAPTGGSTFLAGGAGASPGSSFAPLALASAPAGGRPDSVAAPPPLASGAPDGDGAGDGTLGGSSDVSRGTAREPAFGFTRSPPRGGIRVFGLLGFDPSGFASPLGFRGLG